MSVKLTLGDMDFQGQDDASKSLDTVIQERGYKKPVPSYRGLKFGGEDLRAKGRNEKLQSSPRSGTSSPSSSNFTCQKTVKLDAMSNSLDAIINDRGISKGKNDKHGESKGEREGLYEKMKRSRKEFDEKVRQSERDVDSASASGFGVKRPRVLNRMTPYKAVTFLNGTFMEIEIKIGKKVKYTTEDSLVSQKWRCVLKCGAIEGVAESFRKIVAREIACLEFLNKLKEVYPDGKMPEYELPDEILLDPGVYEAIEVLGKDSGAKISFEVGNDERAIGFGDKPAGMYKCTYYLDKRSFIGRSASKEVAQLKAAGKLYETLTGKEFPSSRYSTGLDCDSFEEYDFSESPKWID